VAGLSKYHRRAVPLAAGVAMGAVSGGLAVATGALNVSFSDSHDPYVQRGGRMLVASVLVGLAVFVGSMWGSNNLAAVLIAGLWAFAAGMLVALNTTAADIGTISLVTLIVYSAVPQSPERAVYGGLLAFSGGLLQTLLAVLMWPLRRYAPEQRAARRPVHRTCQSSLQAGGCSAVSSGQRRKHARPDCSGHVEQCTHAGRREISPAS